jgi:hypothetical protein
MALEQAGPRQSDAPLPGGGSASPRAHDLGDPEVPRGADLVAIDEVPSPIEEAPQGVARPTTSRRRGQQLIRARQVERLVRRVRLWSVLRVALVFYLCLWFILTVAGAILWRVAVSAGAIDSVESFLAELLVDESDSFVIDGGTILQASALGGLILVVAGTAVTVLLALLFNLISELTGGIRVAVVELETAELVESDGPTEVVEATDAEPSASSPDGDRVR